ncbi:MAG: DUF4124 domain-containing protein [Burkholderiales bacterium]|jgi:hypothetical protein|nr:DUF4124 domain-containing protein [Burkholderiales bacterium]
MRRVALLVAALLASASWSSLAQEVRRCEGADGRVSYADGACPPGTAAVRTLPPAAVPNDGERAAAQRRAEQDLRQIAQIERARQADEERAARQQQQSLAQARKLENHCRRLQTRLDAAKEELDGASRARQRTQGERRLRRAEDLYVADCGPLRN